MVSMSLETINPAVLTQSGRSTLDDTTPQASDSSPPRKDILSQKPGDSVITTKDGAAFCIHFDVLACASSVFCSLLTLCASPNTYLIDENSEDFLCFTELAYSRDVPPIKSFSALDQALTVATKYDLKIMKRILRGLLLDVHSGLYLEEYPISAYDIALKHGFSPEQAQTSRLLIRTVDVQDHTSVQALRGSPTGVYILNMLALRRATLADSLLSLERSVVLVDDPHTLSRLSCLSCFSAARLLKIRYVQWMMYWAHNAYEILSTSCLTMENGLFEVGHILEMMSRPASCLDCRLAIITHYSTFKAWLKGVQGKLEQRLLDVSEQSSELSLKSLIEHV